LLVLVKPAGLPTANAPRGADSVVARLRRRRPGAFWGVVSRLDAPVSGVLVIARTSAAAADLARQFRDRTVGKSYAAIVTGRFPAPLGRWVDWHDTLRRQEGERRSELRPGTGADDVDDDAIDDVADHDDPAGRPAHVRGRVVRRAGEVSLVELEPTTGRRHQLRAQLAARGCPIVGDRLYGARLPFAAGIALHARRLTFDHPRTGARLEFTAPWPTAWRTRFPTLFSGPRPPAEGPSGVHG